MSKEEKPKKEEPKVEVKPAETEEAAKRTTLRAPVRIVAKPKPHVPVKPEREILAERTEAFLTGEITRITKKKEAFLKTKGIDPETKKFIPGSKPTQLEEQKLLVYQQRLEKLEADK